MKKKEKVILLILDGLGLGEKNENNPVHTKGMPFLEKMKESFPYTELKASGEAVGLEDGQMGNSEVGHLTLGAGKIIKQDLTRINEDVKTGKLKESAAIKKVVKYLEKSGGTLHLWGLLSDGGVHSHISHLKAIIESVKSEGVKNITLHAVLDGRDVKIDSGIDFLEEMNGMVDIGTVIGRYYAMDREKRYERVKVAYDMMFSPRDEYRADSIYAAVEGEYLKGHFDEYMPPIISKNYEGVKDGDVFFIFNFRGDRAREMAAAVSEGYAGKEEIEKKDVLTVGLTEYDSLLKNIMNAYSPIIEEKNLASIISKNGLGQYHISETTKYAHVTFFFNGGVEEAYEGEDRCLIESHNVENFKVVPEMRAVEISEGVISAMDDDKYAFILANLSNLDMIGHTADRKACEKAIEVIDDCVKKIVNKALEKNIPIIVTADHGNIEKNVNDDGSVCTTHTNNLVPFHLISEKHKGLALKKGGLSNVAPTVLKLLNLEKDMVDKDPSLF